jgi:polyisoprenoid-binding protein YceI
MKILISIFAFSLILTSAVFAQSAATHDAGKIESGTYAVDPYHTQVTFGVSHMGFSHFRGRFNIASGTLQLDTKKPAGSTFHVEVAADSVDTPVEKLTGELKDEAWLDAKKFPQITFRATNVTITAPDEAKVTGDFTLHGVTKPLTLSAKLIGGGINPLTKKYNVGFELSGKIQRSDFGVKTYVPLIGDEVDLTISAAFERRS